MYVNQLGRKGAQQKPGKKGGGIKMISDVTEINILFRGDVERAKGS